MIMAPQERRYATHDTVVEPSTYFKVKQISGTEAMCIVHNCFTDPFADMVVDVCLCRLLVLNNNGHGLQDHYYTTHNTVAEMS